jgi:hypothetical protein
VFLNGLILIVTLAAGVVLLMPRVAGIKTWRATMTPLASIIGSGFLVLGPILDSSYGKYARCLPVRDGDPAQYSYARGAGHRS